MHDFLLKEITHTNIEQELANIGFDATYIHKAKNKFEYKNIKIFNLNCAQANILKQTALSVGADCATHREVITGKIETSDVILGGSIGQIEKIIQKLQHQPFGLKNLAESLKQLSKTQSNTTKIIGILNLTTDSFTDGGEFYDFENAKIQLHKLINEGADIIDIGAESTKPGSKGISPQKQLEKLIPVLDYIRNNNLDIPISIDTRSSVVANECIKLGAEIINDVSGFDFDPNMPYVIANNPNTKIIIQHSQGTPETMQNNPQYENLMDEIYTSLNNKVNLAIQNGVKKENIIIDPGIGFGKSRKQNFEIIEKWQELRSIGCPILLGISRKSFLNIQNDTNEEKDIYTLSLNSILIKENIDYIRVHNVKIHKKFINIIYEQKKEMT